MPVFSCSTSDSCLPRFPALSRQTLFSLMPPFRSCCLRPPISQLAPLFTDSLIFSLGNLKLHIVRLFRSHIFYLPHLTFLFSPAASHSPADLAFAVHFFIHSASPSLTLPSLSDIPHPFSLSLCLPHCIPAPSTPQVFVTTDFSLLPAN